VVVAAPPPPVHDDNPFASAFAAGEDAAPDTSDLAFASTAAATPRRTRRRKKRGCALLLVGLSLVLGLPIFCAGLVTVWIVWYTPSQDDPIPDSPSAGNFVFHKPAAPWKEDTSIERIMSLNYAMKKSGPDNNLALLFRDYKTRSPSEAELQEEALTRLRAYIPAGLQTEPKPDKKTLGNQPALVLAFAGNNADSVPIAGECYMLTYRGYAYWFFTWGPEIESERLAPEWEQLRQSFVLGNNREGWKESGRETETARGTKIGYHLDPVKVVWKKEALNKPEVREQYGDKADLVLIGTYPGDRKAMVRSAYDATAQVVILDKVTDLMGAVDAAKAYLLEMEKDKREGGFTYPNTTIDFVPDKSIEKVNEPIGSGKAKGHLLKLLVENDPNRKRYVVLRVVNHAQGVVVLCLECDYRRRDFWETEFTTLLETLQF
jgi:hypothetical protein